MNETIADCFDELKETLLSKKGKSLTKEDKFLFYSGATASHTLLAKKSTIGQELESFVDMVGKDFKDYFNE